MNHPTLLVNLLEIIYNVNILSMHIIHKYIYIYTVYVSYILLVHPKVVCFSLHSAPLIFYSSIFRTSSAPSQQDLQPALQMSGAVGTKPSRPPTLTLTLAPPPLPEVKNHGAMCHMLLWRSGPGSLSAPHTTLAAFPSKR